MHCTVCAEKPHWGAWGEPFMYKMMGFSEICSLMESNTSSAMLPSCIVFVSVIRGALAPALCRIVAPKP